MKCCCPHAQSASRLFSFFARSYRKRFEKRGFEPSQRQLLEGLQNAGYQNASILEIGSGVGHLHQTMLEQGANTAVGIDLAEDMISEAKLWANDRGLQDKVAYYAGDFMQLIDKIDSADIGLLDKVVCCYPDAEGLIQRSLSKTRKIYGLTYPRDRWYNRAGVSFMTLCMKLLRSDFRPYVHDPQLVERWIIDSGYKKHWQATTTIWLTQVYVKA